MSRLASPIRKNDTVTVMTGKERGKQGRVLKRFVGEPNWAQFHELVERALAAS